MNRDRKVDDRRIDILGHDSGLDGREQRFSNIIDQVIVWQNYLRG